MFKKAGIIVGATLIILAIVIYGFASRTGKSKVEGAKTPSSSTQNTVQQQPTNVAQNNNNSNTNTASSNNNATTDNNQGSVNNNTQNTSQNNVSNPPKVDNTNNEAKIDATFKVVQESDLGKPSLTKNEIMVVAEKKVILLDGSISTNTNKELVYCIDVLGSDNRRISVFLNKIAYDSIKVGDKLAVNYVIYKNDVGTEFPTVMSVDAIK